MQAYYPSNESPNRHRGHGLTQHSLMEHPCMMQAKQRSIAAHHHHHHHFPLITSKQLDPWTLYELEKETKKLKIHADAKLHNDEEVQVPRVIPPRRRSSSRRLSSSSSSSSSSRANNNKKNSTKNRRSMVTLPLRHSDETIHQRIESAKSRRKSLLLEVRVLNLYQEQQKQRRSSSSTTMSGGVYGSGSSSLGDSISSLPDLEDDDRTSLFGDEEDNDHHKSCYF